MKEHVKDVLKLSEGVKKACDDFLKDKPEKIVNDIFGIGKMVKK